MLEENIKDIHKEFDLAKKTIFTRKDGLKFKKAKRRWIFGKVHLTMTMTKTALRPGRRLKN